MSITQNGTRTTRVNSTAGTSCSVPIPTGMTTSHYMVLAVSISGNVTASLTTPTGWTPIGTDLNNSTSITLALFGKFWASGDTAPAPSWTGSAKNTGTIVPFLGVDLTTPIDSTVPAFATGSSTTPTSPTSAATTRGACRLHIEARATAGSSTPDPQMIEATDIGTSTPSPAALSFDYQLGMAEGATGTRSNTVSTGAWVAASVWLRPAAADSFGLLQVRSTTTSTPSNPDTLAFSNALTSGSTLAVKVASFFPSAPQTSVTYPGGSFTQYADVHTTNSEAAIYLFQNNTRTTADTVSVNFSGSVDAGIVIEEWLGPPTTGTLVDQTGTGSNAGSTAVSATTTGATTTGERLALNMVGVGTTQTAYTFDTSYVQRGSNLSNAHMAWAAQSAEFAGGASETANMTLSTSSDWASSLVVLMVAGGAGGTTYNQACNAVGSGVASILKQANATRATLTTGVPSIVKAVSPTAKSVAGTGVPSIIKQAVPSPKSVVGTGVPTVTKQAVLMKSVTGVGVPTSLTQKVKIWVASATGVGVASVAKAVGAVRSAAGTGVPTVAKAVSATRTATGTGVPTLSTLKVKTWIASAVGVGVASLSKSVGTTRSVAGVGVPSTTKRVGAVRSAVGVGAASVAKRVGAVRTAVGTGVPTSAMLKVKTWVASAVGMGVASLSKSVGATRSATGTGVPTVAKAVAITRSAVSTGSPLVTKAVTITKTATSTGVASVAKSVGVIRSAVSAAVTSLVTAVTRYVPSDKRGNVSNFSASLSGGVSIGPDAVLGNVAAGPDSIVGNNSASDSISGNISISDSKAGDVTSKDSL